MADFTNIAVGDKIWTANSVADVVRVTRTQFTAVVRDTGYTRRFRKSDGQAVDGWGDSARELTEKDERIFNLEKIVIESSRKVYALRSLKLGGAPCWPTVDVIDRDICALIAVIDALRELRELRDA